MSLNVTLGGLLRHLTFVFSLFRVPGIFLLKTYCVILTSRYLVTFSLSHQQENSFCTLQASPCCFHSNFQDLTLLVLPHDFRPSGLRRESNTSSSTKIQMASLLRWYQSCVFLSRDHSFLFPPRDCPLRASERAKYLKKYGCHSWLG